ncbi:radical SAM protein [Streptomyces sp. NPDC056672]|uniref:radical SAM protein n=1 Tax=Streptomyces sp. NPDC056672 TaxID=3345906 RepID=UPI00369E6142
MTTPSTPESVIWDTTYACPLRCIHCYSESGRRAARQLDHEDMLRVTDALISMKPRVLALAGGEPLLVKGIFDITDRLVRAGVKTVLYTGGWTLRPWMADRLAELDEVIVSVDGATAEVHDRIRGRAGSFDRAMAALALLDSAARERVGQGLPPLRFGIDYVVVRSNFAQLEEFCRVVAGRFPELRSVNFNAAIPSGLASGPGFGDDELLPDAQVAELVGAGLVARLTAAAPESVRVFTTDNMGAMMHPDRLASGDDALVMQVEPDGEVRAMSIYEGTVGSLLDEPPPVLWERAVARWRDPFVVETLTPVRTMRQWAEAVRRIDYRFGTDEVRARIDRRSPSQESGAAPV